MKVDTDSEDAVAIVEFISSTKRPVTLSDDMNIALLIKNKDIQSIKVTVDNGENSTTRTYGLIGLTLETK